ncbi:MAG TPA: bifunctional methionine sulfoxide reductase B/A protein [Bacteroidales bacterium]|nr:bifunctional methionine sulfoxide reductase B/A protein [Bacteroidales bacterium]HOX78216.1 bifunctional methionine sulfoxide reductase B/A protein [Bacteroidales bacterium]HPI85349.1 bifunctional methionine sulfoxide reductase B/A protein [Bacteroidales bacterium]HPM92398.1 bifunctional methionine sulfoxide reductase B/A protein [Bacteroidales bacterium]
MIRQAVIVLVSIIPTIIFSQNNMKYNKLTTEEEYIIIQKGTERPWTGKYLNNKETGTYTCRRCDAPLYRSEDKFDSHCGWPSFDDEIKGAVKRIPDPDGMRTEIICASCGGHLGHVFLDEGFTDKNTRHCVNSISMNFIPDSEAANQAVNRAIFAGGCFWGVEYYMQKKPGVISVVSGYIGGHKDNPTYQEVCTGTTGHAEAVEITFDPSKVSYEELARLFFEIHDPTQVNRQGPDVGAQYRSEIFYLDENQKIITENLIGILKNKGFKVATKVTKATTFWPAENYHQDYYDNKGTLPYCHGYTKRF